jgi:hypothetical protein
LVALRAEKRHEQGNTTPVPVRSSSSFAVFCGRHDLLMFYAAARRGPTLRDAIFSAGALAAGCLNAIAGAAPCRPRPFGFSTQWLAQKTSLPRPSSLVCGATAQDTNYPMEASTEDAPPRYRARYAHHACRPPPPHPRSPLFPSAFRFPLLPVSLFVLPLFRGPLGLPLL